MLGASEFTDISVSYTCWIYRQPGLRGREWMIWLTIPSPHRAGQGVRRGPVSVSERALHPLGVEMR